MIFEMFFSINLVYIVYLWFQTLPIGADTLFFPPPLPREISCRNGATSVVEVGGRICRSGKSYLEIKPPATPTIRAPFRNGGI